MSDKEALDAYVKGHLPEALKGFDINWSGYVPGGGFEWQRNYEESGRKVLKDIEREALSNVEDFETKRARVSRAVVDIDEILERLARVDETLEMFAARPSDSVDLLAGIDRRREMIEAIDLFDGAVRRSQLVLTVARGMMRLFDMDAELDLEMWGISLIDERFRTKVFRDVYRRYCEIVQTLATVGKAIDDLGKGLEVLGHFKGPYEALVAAYESLGAQMKSMRKGLAARGQAFWKETPLVVQRNMRTMSTVCAAGWNPEFGLDMKSAVAS